MTDTVKIKPTDVLEISPLDAENLSLKDGEKVRLRSRYAEAVLPVHIVTKVKKGELFTTFHDAETKLNRITSKVRDRYVQAPEFKVTAVAIEKILS